MNHFTSNVIVLFLVLVPFFQTWCCSVADVSVGVDGVVADVDVNGAVEVDGVVVNDFTFVRGDGDVGVDGV